MTKQAASKLVDQLVDRGYVARDQDPQDARRRPLRLTPQGLECTQAADECAADVAREWQRRLGQRGAAALRTLLRELDLDGPVRPVW